MISIPETAYNSMHCIQILTCLPCLALGTIPQALRCIRISVRRWPSPEVDGLLQAERYVQQYQASLAQEGEEATRHLLAATATLTAAVLSLSSSSSYRPCLRYGCWPCCSVARQNLLPWGRCTSVPKPLHR